MRFSEEISANVLFHAGDMSSHQFFGLVRVAFFDSLEKVFVLLQRVVSAALNKNRPDVVSAQEVYNRQHHLDRGFVGAFPVNYFMEFSVSL
jgi:hypothetical protein